MKLGKVEFCHFLQLIALFLCFSGMSQAELSRSGSKPYFQSGRSRTKRSWVWNQFFVLEEYMGSDPLYVGKVGHLAFQSHKWLLWMSVVGWRTAIFALGMETINYDSCAIVDEVFGISRSEIIVQVVIHTLKPYLREWCLFLETEEESTDAWFTMIVAH